MEQTYCQNCGKQVNPSDRFCPNCGAPLSAYGSDEYQEQQGQQFQQNNNQQYSQGQPIYQNPAVSDKDWIVTLLLCIFAGSLGIHRFYAGKIGTGVLWLLTGGCFFIGSIIDLIMIVMDKFKDGNDLPIIRRPGNM